MHVRLGPDAVSCAVGTLAPGAQFTVPVPAPSSPTSTAPGAVVPNVATASVVDPGPDAGATTSAPATDHGRRAAVADLHGDEDRARPPSSPGGRRRTRSMSSTTVRRRPPRRPSPTSCPPAPPSSARRRAAARAASPARRAPSAPCRSAPPRRSPSTRCSTRTPRSAPATNTATATSSTARPDPANNPDTATTTVTGTSDLSITKTADSLPGDGRPAGDVHAHRRQRRPVDGPRRDGHRPLPTAFTFVSATSRPRAPARRRPAATSTATLGDVDSRRRRRHHGDDGRARRLPGRRRRQPGHRRRRRTSIRTHQQPGAFTNTDERGCRPGDHQGRATTRSSPATPSRGPSLVAQRRPVQRDRRHRQRPAAGRHRPDDSVTAPRADGTCTARRHGHLRPRHRSPAGPTCSSRSRRACSPAARPDRGSSTSPASTSTTLDPTDSNNVATFGSDVTEQTDLTITKQLFPPTASCSGGVAVGRAITVTNAGPSTAKGVTVLDNYAGDADGGRSTRASADVHRCYPTASSSAGCRTSRRAPASS